ncbi:YopX family protein [Romboutsia sp. 1001713B170207_170306_H8]|uniref:YopX family protein n=1 Tax=Romboutsia sp. 1001713B170207_170306_H8 TaxID=2787112 RepID=UPI001898FB63|nr:YopX family protein [Romboutsia sp. 1001713B170207_170306_H8]
MREIKFRGYSKEKLIGSQWITNGYGVSKINYTDGTSSVHLLSPYGDYWVEEDSIGQYTGLKDKNGKDIYEGDILDYGIYGKFEVLYHKGSFKIRKLNFKNGNVHLLEEYSFDDIKVIGNIYENSELLG